MNAHVICCNNRIEHVVMGSESSAQTKLEALQEKHRKENAGLSQYSYDSAYYWHIHSVEGEQV